MLPLRQLAVKWVGVNCPDVMPGNPFLVSFLCLNRKDHLN